jgi:hypothetical protein
VGERKRNRRRERERQREKRCSKSERLKELQK